MLYLQSKESCLKYPRVRHNGKCDFCKSSVPADAMVCKNCNAYWWWVGRDKVYKGFRQECYETNLAYLMITVPLSFFMISISCVLALLNIQETFFLVSWGVSLVTVLMAYKAKTTLAYIHGHPYRWIR